MMKKYFQNKFILNFKKNLFIFIIFILKMKNILHYLVLIIVFTLHKSGLYLQKMVYYIKKAFSWLLEKGYNNPILYIGLILYVYIIYRILFRTRTSGPINDIPITSILIISYLIITIGFLIGVIYILYKLSNKTHSNNPFDKTPNHFFLKV